MTIKLSDKSKRHIEDSFEKLFDSVPLGIEAFTEAFKEYEKNRNSMDLLAEHLKEGMEKEGGDARPSGTSS